MGRKRYSLQKQSDFVQLFYAYRLEKSAEQVEHSIKLFCRINGIHRPSFLDWLQKDKNLVYFFNKKLDKMSNLINKLTEKQLKELINDELKKKFLMLRQSFMSIKANLSAMNGDYLL
jgi:hypothetical protein